MKSKILLGNICGGLGNQMFQYAAYKAQSIESSRDLILAIDSFANYELYNGYELQRVFGIGANFADVNISDYLGPFSNITIRKALSIIPEFCRPKSFLYDDSNAAGVKLLSSSLCIYSHGYWQSEANFSGYADLIRNEFEFSQPLPDRVLQIVDSIVRNNSISLHIRRGDYVSNPRANKYHGLCSVAYYIQATGLIKRLVSNPFYFIFTDDPTWAKETICPLLENSLVVEGNVGQCSYIDMQLMSLCKHNIIANSSFSWWGAWLNKSREKIVIAPSRWFTSGKISSDILPLSWVKF
jgi:hypothetical protein